MNSEIFNLSSIIGGTLTQAVGNPIFLGLSLLALLILTIVILRFDLGMSLVILIPASFIIMPMIPGYKVIFAFVTGYLISIGLLRLYRGV